MKNTLLIIKELPKRWRAEMPVFWKRVSRFWALVTYVASFIIGIEAADLDIISQVLPDSLEPYIITVSKYAAAIGVMGMLQAKFTMVAPDKDETKI